MSNFRNKDLIVFEDFNYWESKKLYIELMQKFINQTIDGRQFEIEFCRMWKKDRDKNYSLQQLLNKTQHLDLNKLKGFSALLADLFNDREVFQPDPALRKSYEISEDKLRECVQKVFLEIQNNYP